MRGGETDARRCYHHVNPMWLCLSVLPLGGAVLGHPLPRGTWPPAGLTAQPQCPNPPFLHTPPKFTQI